MVFNKAEKEITHTHTHIYIYIYIYIYTYNWPNKNLSLNMDKTKQHFLFVLLKHCLLRILQFTNTVALRITRSIIAKTSVVLTVLNIEACT